MIFIPQHDTQYLNFVIWPLINQGENSSKVRVVAALKAVPKLQVLKGSCDEDLVSMIAEWQQSLITRAHWMYHDVSVGL